MVPISFDSAEDRITASTTLNALTPLAPSPYADDLNADTSDRFGTYRAACEPHLAPPKVRPPEQWTSHNPILYGSALYTPGGWLVTKRLVDLDDDLLAAAQKELKTSGVSDTVRMALQQAAALSARARQVAWLKSGGLEEMTSPDQRGDVWR